LRQALIEARRAPTIEGEATEIEEDRTGFFDGRTAGFRDLRRSANGGRPRRLRIPRGICRRASSASSAARRGPIRLPRGAADTPKRRGPGGAGSLPPDILLVRALRGW